MFNVNGGAYESTSAGNRISLNSQIPTHQEPQVQARNTGLICGFLTGPILIAQNIQSGQLRSAELQPLESVVKSIVSIALVSSAVLDGYEAGTSKMNPI